MFGMEKQKRVNPQDFVFDLERDCKDPKKRQEIKAKIESKIQRIKEILRAGEEKEDFDQLGVLLHGYTSLLKVISRIGTK